MLDRFKGHVLHNANRAIQRFGVKLERTTRSRSLMDFIRSRRIDLVIDVGANEGQFGSALREAGYGGTIFSYEPLPVPFEILSGIAHASPPWQAFNFGISDRDGEATINVSQYSVFSSLNKVTERATAFNEGAAIIAQRQVSLRSLDSLGLDLATARPFLKIDTQGHEKQVLSGAGKTLERFLGVQMELPIQQLYESVWEFEEAVAFMRERGFTISNLMPVNFGTGDDAVSLIEVDCVFRNNRIMQAP